MHRTAPLLLAALLAACEEPLHPGLDLGAPLGPDEVRAGIVDDPALLFGGIAAEGQVGDALLVNDRARFVIQGPRPGHYYFRQGGGLLDADVVRAEGEPGRDIVEEWRDLVAGTRLVDARTAAVLDSGVNSGVGRVVVRGSDSPIDLLIGALEAPDLIPPLGLDITTEYALRPGSRFLEVTTTVRATEEEALADIGDVVIVGIEVADRWRPGEGFALEGGISDWLGAMARGNDVAVMLATPDGRRLEEAIPLLSELGDVDVGTGARAPLQPGESLRYTRWYGVGPDLASLTDELLERRGDAWEQVGGVVTAPDGPVARARVVIFVDEAPWTVAVSAADGSWSARVPEGAAVRWQAVGRASGYQADLPGATGHWSPFVAPEAGQTWLDALAAGEGAPPADGRGVASPEDPLSLGQPGTIVVRVADGAPFEVRASREGGLGGWDARIAPGRPDGGDVVGWARDGEVRLTVEPGSWDLLAHRGARFEMDQAEVSVAAGEEVVVDLALPAAYAHPGWLFADPHQHASPSNDGNVSMEERLLVNAARGVQLPFGTDHDRIADYNVLVGPLGLDGVLRSVVANEVSPVRRGHVNAYPLTSNPDLQNAGAWLWYQELVSSTEEQFDILRDWYPGAMFQLNHPLSRSGLAVRAGWSPGVIEKADFWTEDFDAMEVVNSGDTYLELYLDLVSRGLRVAPTAVSDAHGPTSGGIGFNGTFLRLGVDSPAGYTDEALRGAFAAGNVIATRGPFLDLSHLPGAAVEPGATLTVTALHPSWMEVSRIELWRDDARVEVVEGDTASFVLDPDEDAVFTVIAAGDAPMPILGRPAWALAGGFYVDVGGDGWDPPLPPLEIQ